MASRDGAAPPSAAFVDADEGERFVHVGVLGEGGMGRVLAYEDTRIGRRVAVKIARKEVGRTASEALEREARVTGALEHPNIIPIYDLGDDPDWGTFYLMRLVREPSLEVALAKLKQGTGEYTHGKLLRAFIQVCHAVDFAHSRGVVHCDLKPENILLGSFGEVFVVDWGFAFKMGVDKSPRGGTPGFMAPEALARRAARIDGRTDVFSLGCILYQLVTGARPFGQVTYEQWDRAAARGGNPLMLPAPPSEVVTERRVPPELDEICMRAIELERDQRLASAREMAAGLEAFVEGTKAKKRAIRRAEDLVAQGDGLAESHRDLCAGRPEQLAELAELVARVPPWETGAAKESLWDAEDRRAVLDGLAARTLGAAIAAYEHALDEAPDHASARRALSRLYWDELQRAEARRDDRARIQLEALALEHDDGTLAALLRRGGTVELFVPEGSRIAIDRLEAVGPRIEPVREVAVTGSPLALEAGSYRARVTLPGGALVPCPLLVRAGATLRVEIPREPIDAGEAVVAAGTALLGGHETNAAAPEIVEAFVPAFAIARLPVTFGEYLEFLGDEWRRAAAQAARHLPQTEDGDPFWHPVPDELSRGSVESAFVLGRAMRWTGDPARVRSMPVIGVDFASAEAFAAWKSRRTGRRYRLPGEWEWEKAARGVDGRPYPWGVRFDATFCKMRDSRPELPAPEPVGAFPHDESPYGVRDVAGGVAEWVTPRWSATGLAVSRGGAWCDWATECHLAARRAYRSGERSLRVGFRLARDL